MKDAMLAWLTRRGLQVGPIGMGPRHPERQAAEAREHRGARFDHPTV